MLNNIKSYWEGINEAAAALPKMPAFLKNAGAVVVAASKTSHAHPIPEHWGLNINNITKYFPYDKKFEVGFYPISSTEGTKIFCSTFAIYIFCYKYLQNMGKYFIPQIYF